MFSTTIFGLACLLVGSYSAPLEYSDTRYDGLDLGSVLNNDELYTKIFQCLIGSGKCTPDWEVLKIALPRAMLDNCEGCTDKQKHGTRTLLAHLIYNKPHDMLHLEGEHDPDGSYRKQLEKDEKDTNVINRKRSALSEEVESLDQIKRIIK